MFTSQSCFKFSCKLVRRDHAFWLCNRKASQLAQVQKKKSTELNLLFSFEKTSLLLPHNQLTADQSVAVWTLKRLSGAVPCSDASLSYPNIHMKISNVAQLSFHLDSKITSQIPCFSLPLLTSFSELSVHIEQRLTLNVTQTLVIHWQLGEQTFEKAKQHPCSTYALF